MEADKMLVTEIKVSGKLVAIVHQDFSDTTHTPTFYKTEKMGMDEIKDLLNTKPIVKLNKE